MRMQGVVYQPKRQLALRSKKPKPCKRSLLERNGPGSLQSTAAGEGVARCIDAGFYSGCTLGGADVVSQVTLEYLHGTLFCLVTI